VEEIAMRPSHLDHVARSIASGLSRRRLIGGLIGGASTPSLSRAIAAAKKPCRKIGKKCANNGDCCHNAICLKGRCACPRGYRLCDDVCRNLSSDENHCGACGYDCDPHLTCVSGVCLIVVGPHPDDPSTGGDGNVDSGGDIPVQPAP
jgi:hypothetical protein